MTENPKQQKRTQHRNSFFSLANKTHRESPEVQALGIQAWDHLNRFKSLCQHRSRSSVSRASAQGPHRVVPSWFHTQRSWGDQPSWRAQG